MRQQNIYILHKLFFKIFLPAFFSRWERFFKVFYWYFFSPVKVMAQSIFIYFIYLIFLIFFPVYTSLYHYNFQPVSYEQIETANSII